jgi:hypothetical protein
MSGRFIGFMLGTTPNAAAAFVRWSGAISWRQTPSWVRQSSALDSQTR